MDFSLHALIRANYGQKGRDGIITQAWFKSIKPTAKNATKKISFIVHYSKKHYGDFVTGIKSKSPIKYL